MGCSSSQETRTPSKARPGGRPIVTLTGVTGYLGSQVCLLYLKDGGFRVRGTVRDKSNEAKLAPLREAFGALFSELELVEANLDNEQSMIDAIRGSTYVVHMASPFFMKGNEETLVAPAVNGTLAAMKACQAAGVKRCVVTSSVASVMFMAEADRPADNVFNESHWSNPDRPEGFHPYLKSKTLAEKTAWDFQKALPEAERFEIVTICPGFIMGPPLKKESSTSIDWMKNLLDGTTKEISSGTSTIVDVRDVAQAHLLAIKNAKAANRRFLLVHSNPSYLEYAAPVEAKYRPLGWPITEAKAAPKANDRVSLVDNSASKELGVVYTDMAKTMVDMADTMVAKGMVTKPAAAPQ